MYLLISAYYAGLRQNAGVTPGDMPEEEESGALAELNAQPKLVWRNRYRLNADISLMYESDPDIESDNGLCFRLIEGFVDLSAGEIFYFKTGKKREIWSVGHVFFPVDIINTPKNPLDPFKSREGTYLALMEIPAGTSALSLVYFPMVEFDADDRSGIPSRMDWEDGGIGIRTYLLVHDTDLSFVYYYIDRIPTVKRNYLGMTLNRYFGYLGMYVEALGHKGRDADTILKDDGSDKTYVDLSAGTDYTFSDDTKVSIEYLRNSEGYGRNEFDRLCDSILGGPGTKSDPSKASDMMRQRSRRNYLGLSVARPNTFDDFFPRVMAIICLDDGSFALNSLIDYFVRDDTTVQVGLGGTVGSECSEYGLKPDEYRATLEVRYYW
jgi:hypothetical protein